MVLSRTFREFVAAITAARCEGSCANALWLKLCVDLEEASWAAPPPNELVIPVITPELGKTLGGGRHAPHAAPRGHPPGTSGAASDVRGAARGGPARFR